MTDKEYRYLSDEVYRVDRDKQSKLLKKDDILDKSGVNNNFKVLKVEDNRNNGMQAMAVAPVKEDGKVGTGHSLGGLVQRVELEYNV